MNDARTSNRWNTSGNRILGVNIIKKALILVLFVLLGGMPAHGQEVIRKGNTFEQISSKQKKFAGAIKTKYTYKDANGVIYPIYISRNNKVFVIKINKKGKQYPYYLKDIEDQILYEYGKNKKMSNYGNN